MQYRADELCYEYVEVLGERALFAEVRVLRDSVPEGVFVYEVRHDDECQGEPVEIARRILVNFLGTLLMKEQLEPVEKGEYCYIGREDWEYIGERSYRLGEYLGERDMDKKELDKVSESDTFLLAYEWNVELSQK